MSQRARQPVPSVVESEASLEYLLGLASALASGDTKKQLDDLQAQLERLKRQSQSLKANLIAQRTTLASVSAKAQRPGQTMAGVRSALALPLQNESESTNLVGQIADLRQRAARDLDDLKLVESALRRFQHSVVGVTSQAAFVNQWPAAKKSSINHRVAMLLLDLPALCRSKIQIIEAAAPLTKWPP